MRVAALERSLREEFPRFLTDGEQIGLRELEALRARTRRFADAHVRPRALQLDRRTGEDPSYFDWGLVRAGAEHGMLRLLIPTQAGGDGAMTVQGAVVMEELCAACPGIALIFGAHGLGVSPLLLGGPSQWDGVLSELVASERTGSPQLMAFAITEPEAGTDVEDPDLMRRGRITSHARRVPGGFRLSGTKRFISNGSVASWMTVFMATDPQSPAETWTCFLVDTRSEGFSVGRVEHKMGQRACPAAELTFDEVFVPDERVVAREGDGAAATMIVLASSRAPVGAIATGIARGAYERLLAWLEEDPAAKGMLARQHVQLELAVMEEEIHLARQAYMDAAMELDFAALGHVMSSSAVRAIGRVPAGIRKRARVRRWLTSDQARDATAVLLHRATSERAVTRALALSSLAKARGGDVAMRVTGAALELVGLRAGPVRAELQKLWRDAKLTQIYEGTNQLNRIEVFRGLCHGEAMNCLPPLRHDRLNTNESRHIASPADLDRGADGNAVLPAFVGARERTS
ncbi:MAG: acyl-CoA dehydrogenase family protein [Solirubrobacteraceae bacterium]